MYTCSSLQAQHKTWKCQLRATSVAASSAPTWKVGAASPIANPVAECSPSSHRLNFIPSLSPRRARSQPANSIEASPARRRAVHSVMALETVALEHLPASHAVHVALFRDVENAAALHQQLLARNADFEYAFIDASVVRPAVARLHHQTIPLTRTLLPLDYLTTSVTLVRLQELACRRQRGPEDAQRSL